MRVGRLRLAGTIIFAMAALVVVSRPAASQSAPTFSRDVAPILHRQCIGCHQENAIGGFSLISYREARPWARAIREQVVTREMPPWKPEPGYGQFLGERSLTNTEIDIIRSWVDAGAPEGDPREVPARPGTDGGWQLGEPDLIVRLEEPYQLAAGNEDTFRNFVFQIPIGETRYVRTLELRPGGRETVHHAIMAVDDTASSRRRDAEDEAPGFPGMDMGQAFMPDGHLVGWTPGMSPFPGLDDSPWRLEPGTDLVVQLHLLAGDQPVLLQPEIGFFFSETPPSGPPMQLIRLNGDHQLDIPPGVSDFTVSDSVELPVDVTVFSVYPHAHLIGKAVEGWAVLPDGSREWLVKIDDWDFAWQDIYRLAQPVRLPSGSTLHMRFRYDNSTTNPANPTTPPRRVTAGNRSFDEMAHLQLQVQLAAASDRPLLQAALSRRAIERNPANPWSHRELGNALRDLGQDDEALAAYRVALMADPEHVPTHLDLGAVLEQTGRADEAAVHFEEAVRLDPASADGFYNLGTLLTASGRPAEAIDYLLEAIRLEPNMAVAHTNLGQALASSGQVAAALPHFQRGVELNPSSAEARNGLGVALANLGRFADAILRFRETLELDPRHTRARDNLELATEILAEQPTR